MVVRYESSATPGELVEDAKKLVWYQSVAKFRINEQEPKASFMVYRNEYRYSLERKVKFAFFAFLSNKYVAGPLRSLKTVTLVQNLRSWAYSLCVTSFTIDTKAFVISSTSLGLIWALSTGKYWSAATAGMPCFCFRRSRTTFPNSSICKQISQTTDREQLNYVHCEHSEPWK